MTLLQLWRILRSWRRFPPAPVALARLERITLAVHGVDPSAVAEPERQPAPRSYLMSAADAEALLAFGKGSN